MSGSRPEDKADGAGDGSSSSSSKSKSSLVLMEDLSSQVRHLVKQGKITIHSVMAIWVGSPYGAAEAFKISHTSPASTGWSLEDEMETKFSSALFDMIDILLNLQQEDPSGFWHGGLKDAALETLVPLAAQVTQLRRKLYRMTATLERQANELGRLAADLERTKEAWTKSPSSSSVQNKRSHCHKIRQAMRQAFFSLSSRTGKKLPESQTRKQISEKSSASESCQNSCGETSKKSSTEEHKKNESPTVFVGRNKSERLGGRGHLCSEQVHIGGGGEDILPRPRLVPSHLFIQQQPADISIQNPIQEEQTTRTCENGDEQVKGQVNQEKVNVAEEQGHRGDSRGFNLENPEENATSYLEDYCRCNLDASLKKSDAMILASDSDGNFLEKTKEEGGGVVVVVRSAVSNFAESEFGLIDSEDLEWLQGIEARGETGHICADEIEQSERLKRQSIFMHCFRYRAGEILKDIHIVSQALRAVERKWVDPADAAAAATSDRDLNHFQLDELVKSMVQWGQSWTLQLYEQKDTENERLVAIKLAKTAHEDVAACCRSFKRFSTMVTADTNFLRDLSLGFPAQPNDNSREQQKGPDGELAAAGGAKGTSKGHLVARTCPVKDLQEIFSPSNASFMAS